MRVCDKALINETKGNHRGGSNRLLRQEDRVLIYEVTCGGLLSGWRAKELTGQLRHGDTQRLVEIRNLLLFGSEISPRMIQNEIETHQFVFDDHRWPLPSIAVVFLSKRGVKRTRAQMVDLGVVAADDGDGMAIGEQLSYEIRGDSTNLTADESTILA